MAWTAPQFTRSQVDKAGRELVTGVVWTEQYVRSLEVINNWRSAHSFPLNTLTVTLKQRARGVDTKALVAQRLKRLSSIEAKLRRQKTRLSQMQDIGGCRAVLQSVRTVRNVHEQYLSSRRQLHALVSQTDYIEHPKSDGYRGIHMVYRYQSRDGKNERYNGLLAEIQLRTRAQHTWATAVETAATFTRQALKWRGGTESWQRFFALMSSIMALRESAPLVSGTPRHEAMLIRELREIAGRLNVRNLLIGWSAAADAFATHQPLASGKLFLLELETTPAVKLRITPFSDRQMLKATEVYLAAEKRLDGRDDGSQAVLVSVDSIDALRSAYPNYYIDTGEFVRILDEVMS